jgi:Tol biopolymer transport system component
MSVPLSAGAWGAMLRTKGRGTTTRAVLCLLVAVALAVPLSVPTTGFATPAPGTLERVNLAFDGEQADGYSSSPSISGDGRYVAFDSEASNLVASDTNGVRDVFVRDRVAGTITRVSVRSDGTEGNAFSQGAMISGNGRYVTFWSEATNLVAGDTNGARDVFVHDLQTGTTERVSRRSDSDEADDDSTMPSISADGRYVVFVSDATNMEDDDENGVRDVFLHDRNEDSTTRVSGGIGGSDITQDCYWPRISGDGSTIVFSSAAPELVSGDLNGRSDVFAHTISSGARVIISSGLSGAMANGESTIADVSSTGRYVVFLSWASNLVEGDTTGTGDYFVRDRVAGTTERITVTPTGGAPSIQAEEWPLSISADGRFVVFSTQAFDLIAGDTNNERDIFLRDRTLGQTTRVSVSSKGIETLQASFHSAISANGRYVAFDSQGANLVLGDTNGEMDVYVRDLQGVYVPNTTVVAGADRFKTAVEVSRAAYPDGLDPAGAKTIVIATGRNWPDALGGVGLAGVLDGPVLLVDTNSVPDAVQTEIGRLKATKAIILGGTGAVGPAVATWLATKLGGSANVDRIAGGNRYETADKIARRVIDLQGSSFDEVAFIATGGNFPDALAAAPVAFARKWPIVLSNPVTGLSDGAKAVLDDVAYAVILGGPAAVPVSVEQYLTDTLGDESSGWDRIQGANRYATAVAVAEGGKSWGTLEWDGVGITTGEAFPDALSGGVLQGKRRAPMLLTSPTVLSAETAAAFVLYRGEIDNVTFFGGDSAVIPAVRTAATNALK